MHWSAGNLSAFGAFALLMTLACGMGPLIYPALLYGLYRLTESPRGRALTARWWVRAIPPITVVLTILSVPLSPWLLLPAAILALLLPVAVWWFLRQHTRPGSQLRQRIHRLGQAMLAMMAGGVVSGSLAVLHGTTTGSDAMFPVFILSFLLLLFAHTPMFAAAGVLSEFWAKEAGEPEAHIEAVAGVLRKRGLLVQSAERHLTASGAELTVTMDLRRAPSSIVIERTIEGLPRGLTVRARQPTDAPGIDLGDPLLSELLVVTAADGDDARRRLADLHELLLASLHAWPGSRLSGGVLRVEMTGPPFVPPGRVREEEPTPQRTARALSAQLAMIQELVGALQPSAAQGQAVRRPVRRPLRER